MSWWLRRRRRRRNVVCSASHRSGPHCVGVWCCSGIDRPLPLPRPTCGYPEYPDIRRRRRRHRHHSTLLRVTATKPTVKPPHHLRLRRHWYAHYKFDRTPADTFIIFYWAEMAKRVGTPSSHLNLPLNINLVAFCIVIGKSWRETLKGWHLLDLHLNYILEFGDYF